VGGYYLSVEEMNKMTILEGQEVGGKKKGLPEKTMTQRKGSIQKKNTQRPNKKNSRKKRNRWGGDFCLDARYAPSKGRGGG